MTLTLTPRTSTHSTVSWLMRQPCTLNSWMLGRRAESSLSREPVAAHSSRQPPRRGTLADRTCSAKATFGGNDLACGAIFEVVKSDGGATSRWLMRPKAQHGLNLAPTGST